MDKRPIITICVIGLMLVLSMTSVNAGNKEAKDMNVNNSSLLNCGACPVNLTVDEAWDMLTDTGNGIQIPIDVRYEHEWNAGFIDTPYPESPIWYVKDLFQNNATWLEWFLDEYAGEELIIYCKGGYRSLTVSLILCEAGFTGTVYNMLGGITAWMNEGYPIRNNTQPDAPIIEGPTSGSVGEEYPYTFETSDAEEDGIYYWIDWDDGVPPEWTGPFYEDEVITSSHTWDTMGTYVIRAKCKDYYGDESGWTELEVTMPRGKISINTMFLRFLERFSHAFPLLRHLLGL